MLLSQLADMLRDQIERPDGVKICHNEDSVLMDVSVPRLGTYRIFIKPVIDKNRKVVFIVGSESERSCECTDAFQAVQQAAYDCYKCFAHAYPPPSSPVSPHAFRVQMDKPFKEQTFTKEQRKKLLGILSERHAMQEEWKKLFQDKLEDIKHRDKTEFFKSKRNATSSSVLGKRKFLEADYAVVFDNYFSVVHKDELVIRCLDEIVADAKRGRRTLPWFECVPSGVRACLTTFRHCEALASGDE